MIPSARNDNNPRIFSRSNFLQLLNSAMEAGSYRFARQAALNWLAVFPGDLEVQLYLGKSHLAEGKLAQALPVVERVCRFDPEFLAAVEALVVIYQKLGSDKLEAARAGSVILGSQQVQSAGLPAWVKWHQAARQAAQAGNWAEAEKGLQQVMSVAPDYSLAAIDHLNRGWQFYDRTTIHQLANLYHSRWPDCLQFTLRLAEIEIEFGNESLAVELLHQCVANDANGQTGYRLWGNDHRYQPLWPGGLEIFLDLPIPSEVAFKMGWNRLPTGTILLPEAAKPADQPLAAPEEAAVPAVPVKSTTDAGEPSSQTPVQSQPQDEATRAVEETFARLAKQMKRPSLGRSDGRYPVYVAFTTVKGLDNQFGPQTRDILLKEMQTLVDNVGRRPGWNAMVFCPDQEECVTKLGIKPIEGLDPWTLKLSLSDLDQALAKKGQMIGALVIIGGPDIVPFHHLPNPTDDIDKDVPSDNPYATLDSNYFVPEWPVGRIPGEAGKDAGLLLEQLRALNNHHAKLARFKPQWGAILQWLLDFLRQRAVSRGLKGFGYSASVWKEASALVFKAMGDNNNLLICPPETVQNLAVDQMLKTPLGYFNLHGLPDAAEWYGQKDSSDTTSSPDYPVALSPKSLIKNGIAPQIVFSEACYGANIIEKSEEQAMALRFMSIGCHALVGSTTVSYGSVTAPLIGADLLGYHFWKFLRDGSTVGEALLQAKLALAKEMNQRQGFLDGEDQKTLISFVLYGDPLTGFEAFNTRSKTTLRFKSHPTIKTICDRQIDPEQPVQISQVALREVKAIVEVYLPGLDDAEFLVSEQREGLRTSAGQAESVGSKVSNGAAPSGMVVTITKSVQVARRSFKQYARVTLNPQGKMVKLVVSR
jgi:hypothetical protein